MLVSQEKLQTEFWLHKCSARDDNLTYTPNRVRCFQCNKTKTESAAAGEVVSDAQPQ